MTEDGYSIAEIEQALHGGEFCFFYQPKVSFRNGGIVGAEALLRWIKPDGTLIPPGDFLPLAEETGLITDITAVMLPELIEDIQKIKTIRADAQIAFNVSARDLYSPYLVKMLRSFIGDRRIDPGNIQIEITETAVVDHSDRISNALNELVKLGIEIVMDDYGTGYSSLDVLSRMPFSVLKLDEGVIRRMPRDAKSTHIVRSSLFMARELSLRTVAEGVEDEPSYVFLMSSGCNEAQGFWMSRPLPLAEFLELFAADPRWPHSSFGLLYNAWVDHMSYRRQVLDVAYTMMRTQPEDWEHLPRTDLDHNPARCRLGEWYRSDGRGTGRMDGIDRLEGPHRRMHEAGKTLMREAESKADRPALVDALNIFLELSGVVDAEVSRIVGRWIVESLDGGEEDARGS